MECADLFCAGCRRGIEWFEMMGVGGLVDGGRGGKGREGRWGVR